MNTYNALPRQAIETRYLPPTNTLPSRIKASCERGSITIDFPHDRTGSDCHTLAAEELLAKFHREDGKLCGWGYISDYAIGGTHTGYVFVNAKS